MHAWDKPKSARLAHQTTTSDGGFFFDQTLFLSLSISYPSKDQTWKSINFSLARFSPNPNPYTLSDLGLKRVRVFGDRDLWCRFFFVFFYGSESGIREAMMTGLRERQRAWMLREWWRRVFGGRDLWCRFFFVFFMGLSRVSGKRWRRGWGRGRERGCWESGALGVWERKSVEVRETKGVLKFKMGKLKWEQQSTRRETREEFWSLKWGNWNENNRAHGLPAWTGEVSR